MLRVALEIVLPLLLPTGLYLLWVTAMRPPQPGGAMPWAGMPWLWLGGAGLLLLAFVLVLLATAGGQRNDVYVPPHLENGRVVPGHFLPQERP